MICKKCGAQLDNNATVCPQCGVPTEKYAKTGDMALIIVGMVFAFVFPPLGLLFGILARKHSGEKSWVSPVVVIILSAVGIVIHVAFWIFYGSEALQLLRLLIEKA